MQTLTDFILMKFGDHFENRCHIVDAEFGQNLTLFAKVIKMNTLVHFSPDTLYL